jgi:hypothetical protein
MLPALILIWLVGWGIYCLGHQRENKSRTERPPEKNNVTLMPILELEEIQEEVA